MAMGIAAPTQNMIKAPATNLNYNQCIYQCEYLDILKYNRLQK